MMKDALASPLILTKMRIPVLRKRSLPRTHLIERLSPDPDENLILVCAPAGYGKTTFLSEWARSLQQNDIAVAWYAIDDGDNDLLPFSAYLAASLAQALGPTPDFTHLSRRLRGSPEMNLQKIIPALVNAVATSERACVLILDDYHLIRSPAVHSAVAFLLDHLPGNLRIAIGSRSDPPLPLARLRARGQLLELRAADLRFQSSETGLFLNQVMMLGLPPDGVDTLHARTEGWAAGLQLAALSIAGRADPENHLTAFSGSHRYLVEYLLEEVVNRQSEEVQAFLLTTCVLERMCAPLCDALLGRTSRSRQILEKLEQENIFLITLDEQSTWYRYHHLFRDFLKKQLLKRLPERVPDLHHTACEWLSTNGCLREAVHHALETHDLDYAAAVVEELGYNLLAQGEIATLSEWCAVFPEEDLRRRPMLAVLKSWALIMGFRRQFVDRIEGLLDQVGQAAAGVEDDEQASLLRAHTREVRTYLYLIPDPAADPRALLAQLADSAAPGFDSGPGEFSYLLSTGFAHLALHDAQAAGQALHAARATALNHHLYMGAAESTFHLARLAHARGDLAQAEKICRQGREDISALLPRSSSELPALGCLEIARGCVLLEWDRLDEAEQALFEGIDRTGWGLSPYYLMTALVGLHRLRSIQGRWDEALEVLDSLEEAWPDIGFCIAGLRLVLSIRKEAGSTPGVPAGWRAEAGAWSQGFFDMMDAAPSPPGLGPFGAAEIYYQTYLAWARIQIALGKAEAALEYIEKELHLASTHGLSQRLIEVSLLEALACCEIGERQRTWQAVERAAALAQPAGFLRIFDQDAALTSLLAEAANHGAGRGYLTKVATMTGPPGCAREISPRGGVYFGAIDPAEKRAEPGFREPLSERELAVLRLAARGASNQEIAEQLYITVGTVKSHINHILRKLDVRNRTEAAAMARASGLLDV